MKFLAQNFKQDMTRLNALPRRIRGYYYMSGLLYLLLLHKQVQINTSSVCRFTMRTILLAVPPQSMLSPPSHCAQYSCTRRTHSQQLITRHTANHYQFYPNMTMLRSGLCYCKSGCRLSVCLLVCYVGASYTHEADAFSNISLPLSTLAIL